METAWDKLRYNPVFGPAVPWDFKAYTPQVVVVPVGQNDAHPEESGRMTAIPRTI